jgi:hypothetical protein
VLKKKAQTHARFSYWPDRASAEAEGKALGETYTVVDVARSKARHPAGGHRRRHRRHDRRPPLREGSDDRSADGQNRRRQRRRDAVCRGDGRGDRWEWQSIIDGIADVEHAKRLLAAPGGLYVSYTTAVDGSAEFVCKSDEPFPSAGRVT